MFPSNSEQVSSLGLNQNIFIRKLSTQSLFQDFILHTNMGWNKNIQVEPAASKRLHFHRGRETQAV